MRTTKIHPTAIVDPDARIADDVEVGPFSIVGPQVTIGDETIVQSHVVIEGEVTIGSANLIGHGAVIGTPPQDVSFSSERKTKVEIGNNNVIREYCTIHRGTVDGSSTKIGDKNFLMAGAHIGDRKSTRLNSSHGYISYAVFCLIKFPLCAEWANLLQSPYSKTQLRAFPRFRRFFCTPRLPAVSLPFPRAGSLRP